MKNGIAGAVGTDLVPWNFANCVLLNSPCTACPNSWKKVTASATVNKGWRWVSVKGSRTVVRHQCWAFCGRFGQVSDHGHRWVVPVPVRFNVSRNQTPNGGMRVLRSCVKILSRWRCRIRPGFVLTPREQIEVTISNEVFRALSVLLPDGILLDVCNVFSASLVGERAE